MNKDDYSYRNVFTYRNVIANRSIGDTIDVDFNRRLLVFK